LRGSIDSLKAYFETYVEILWDVVKKSYNSCAREIYVLFEFLNNWPDIFPIDDDLFKIFANSVIGVLFFYSWKSCSWIIFETLCGRYFEAMRNLRFLFEGVVCGVVIEDIIELAVYDKWRFLGSLGLKADIFELLEICRKDSVFDRRRRRVDRDLVKSIVEGYIAISGLKEKEREEYREVYVNILTREELYRGVSYMIGRYCEILGLLDQRQVLYDLWSVMSRFHHFSDIFVKEACMRPDYIFVDIFDRRLFGLCFRAFYRTLDMMYAALLWRFPMIRGKVAGMCDWWKKNCEWPLSLTEAMLARSKI